MASNSRGRNTAKLPTQECKYGYPYKQLVDILGERVVDFNKWMDGQTMAICDGWIYDRKRGFNVTSGCGPHGTVVYSHDVERFLQGRPIID